MHGTAREANTDGTRTASNRVLTEACAGPELRAPQNGFNATSSASWNPALRLVIIGEGRDKLA
jgi:hypothetical protein